jgi:hypothetical protein
MGLSQEFLIVQFQKMPVVISSILQSIKLQCRPVPETLPLDSSASISLCYPKLFKFLEHILSDVISE